MRTLAAGILLSTAFVWAGFDASAWRFRKPVEVPAAALCSLAIDRDVYAASGPGLPDLRLVAAGVETAWVLDEMAGREAVAAAAPSRTEDAPARATLVAIDLGSANLPHDRARIESATPYFYRDTEVEASANGRDWVAVLRHPVFRLPAGEELELAFPERYDRFLRLRIFNVDDRPIAVGRLSVEGFGRSLRFVAGTAGRHWLYYGNPAARRPVYDLARILGQQPPDRGTVVVAGPQQPNPDYRPVATPPKPWTERHPELLYLTLAGAVAGLGYILLRFRREVSR